MPEPNLVKSSPARSDGVALWTRIEARDVIAAVLDAIKQDVISNVLDAIRSARSNARESVIFLSRASKQRRACFGPLPRWLGARLVVRLL